MGQVTAVTTDPGLGETLSGAQFADSYQVRVAVRQLNAAQAARLMFSRQPAWIGGLMKLRNALVSPFGLKTGHRHPPHVTTIGIFPILSTTPNRVVLGFDDHHLDFRVVVDVVWRGEASEVTSTTLVRLNNLFGRIYLTAILPFHRLIVRSTLKSLIV